MKRIICLLLCLVLTLGLLPVSALADAPALDDFEARGNLVKLPVTLEDGTEVYLGVGRWHGSWDVLSSFNSTSSDTSYTLGVTLWRKTVNGSQADFNRLGPNAAKSIFDKLSDISLNVRADTGNTSTPPDAVLLTTENATDEEQNALASGMQQISRYRLLRENKGRWIFTASCTVDSTVYSASGAIERMTVTEVPIHGDDAADVAAVNATLKDAFEEIEESEGQYEIYVNLNEGNYTGQIIIPEISDGRLDDVTVFIRGRGRNYTTLCGGVCSENVNTVVDSVHFMGAGKELERWPNEDGSPNAGKENSAFYGEARGSAVDCTFEEFYYAIKCTYGLRTCGYRNIFSNNNIAWYLDHQEKSGGNPQAQGCIFAENNIAVSVKTFSMKPSFYKLNLSVFLNNECDIQNDSGYNFYVPANAFGTVRSQMIKASAGAEAQAPILRGTSLTCPYPMATIDEDYNIVKGEYIYDQIDEENGDTISNTLASSYPIPESALSGNMYHVADPDTDEILASMIFEAEQDAPAAASEAEPGLARLALAPYALRARAPESSFDATVKLTRPDASTIIFTMNDPCGKTVTLKIPCTFTDGSVLHEGTAIEGAVFDGKAVTFQTSAGGEYTITGQGGQNGLPGMLGSLLGAGALHALGQSTPAFADVPAGSYYASAAQWAQARGIVSGTAQARFSPELACTRAQAVTMLYRAAGCPETVAENPFEDVDANDYFYKAVLWAVANGITSGTDETRFSPDAPCTRGQIVTFLHRAARCTDAHDNFGFTDVKTGAYCEDAVNWAVALGLTNGTGETTFSPEAVCTRAQIVTFLYRNR